MPNNIERMKEGRKDLTDYVIHFTRGMNSEKPFAVLKKIVQDGYLACGWSFRGVRRTIFGSKPAVCFSETPLCGFVDYAQKRHSNLISTYGIFLQKKHLFDAGGRPVIYGTTLEPDERVDSDIHYVDGIAESEQYRYILTTSIDGKNDWTHEREWRWANWRGYSNDDGIFPLWKIGQNEPFQNYNFQFWPIGLIVSRESEAEQLQKILLNNYLLESETLNKQEEDVFHGKFHTLFSFNAIQRTFLIVLDRFSTTEKKIFTIEEIISNQKHIRMNDVLRSEGLVAI
ncbi:MAG: hypothetical protein JST06_02315 [Bacteroidetes bacterium]|nr:hypothetical protein [Bacteroidota bacterium]